MPGIGHDGGRIGVDQNYFIAQFPQGLAGLGAGIVEFAGLADDMGPEPMIMTFLMSFRFGICFPLFGVIQISRFNSARIL